MSTLLPVGVVGAGAMGAGIAQVALSRGHPVVITDAHPPALASAKESIARGLDRLVGKGQLADDARRACADRLTLVEPVDGLSPFADCALIIEAIVERLDVKRQTFGALEQVVSDRCILATNTSSLSVASIGGALSRPERFLGIHFFNPAPVMPLVEIIPGIRSDAAYVEQAQTLVAGWGKTVVRAADTPGFIVNRVARPFYGESLRIYEDRVADCATIDWALRELAGFKMGPFELMDFIGHDVNYVVTESIWSALFYDPRYRPSLAQKRLLEAGWLGKKSGRGFYDYAEGVERPSPVCDAALGERIVHRVLAMLVNEAVDAVHLGLASAADVDVAMTRGVNYPKGLLAWGDELGPDRVLREIDGLFGETHDPRYRASVRLRQAVREGRSLRDA